MARRSAERGGAPGEVVARARALLEGADRDAQRFGEWVRDWTGNPEPLVERILRGAAARDGPAGAESLVGPARAARGERGKQALDLARGLQDALARTLAGLAAAGLVAGVDPGAVTRVALRGLPDLDLGPLAGQVRAPWWGAIPGLTARALRAQFGDSLRALADEYDHHLQLWLTTVGQQLVEAFESQAEVVREQVRRLTTEPEGGAGGERHDLERDAQELLGGHLPIAVGGTVSPGGSPVPR